MFLDNSGISIGPDLWAKIVAGLSRSDWLVVVASEAAKESPWVRQEIEWWLANKSADRIMLLLSGGTLKWDVSKNDWDKENSSALPDALLGQFQSVPVYKEVKWRRDEKVGKDVADVDRAAISISAVVSGKSELELVSEGRGQTRRNRRWAVGAVSITTTLALVASVAAGVAFVQRNHADQQRRIASARLMAASSDSHMSGDVRSALVLAVAAYRTDPNPQTLSALMRANLTSPHLVRYLVADETVTDLATSGDGSAIFAGLADGRVLRWSLADQEPATIGKLPEHVSSLSVSHDGNVVAASDGTQATLWKARRGSDATVIASGEQANVVAVSPSGRTAVVAAKPASRSNSGSLTIYDVDTTKVVATRDNSFNALSHLVAISDDELLFYENANGGWERRTLHDWNRIDGSSPSLGIHQGPGEPAGGGGYTTASNGATPIPVWSTAGPSLQDHPAMTAEAPADYKPSLLTLSNDGHALAVGQDATIYLTPVAPPGTPRPAPLALTGLGLINSSATMRFLGDSNRKVVAASRNLIAIWDADQLDRLSTEHPVPVGKYCGMCATLPTVVVSPDNTMAAIVAREKHEFDVSTMLVPLGSDSRDAEVVMGLSGLPIWRHAGSVSIVTSDKGNRRPPLPEIMRALTTDGDGLAAAGMGSDGLTVVTVDGRGAIAIRDAMTGELHYNIPSPQDLSIGSRRLAAAAVSSAGTLVAMLSEGSITIFDIAKRKTINILGSDVKNIAYAGTHLIVQRRDGALELWTQDGRSLQIAVGGDSSFMNADYASAVSSSLIVREKADGSVVLFAPTGEQLAVLDPVRIGSEVEEKTGITLAPDGHHLITVTEGPSDGSNGLLVERDLSVENLIATACTRAGRDLNAVEWRQLVGIDRYPEAQCPDR